MLTAKHRRTERDDFLSRLGAVEARNDYLSSDDIALASGGFEAMQRFHHYYGDDFTIECPTGSGNMVTIRAAARELASRLTSLFMKDVRGHRPFLGANRTLQEDPHFQGLIQFNEYFDGETGRGCGASHQTGWTGLAAKIIERYYGSGTDGHQQEEAELGLGATGGAGKRGDG